MGNRRARFDALVLDAADRVRPHLGQRYAGVEFAVEDVPPQDPAPWEEQTAPLGRLLRGTNTRAHRVVVYRRPVEARAFGLGIRHGHDHHVDIAARREILVHAQRHVVEHRLHGCFVDRLAAIVRARRGFDIVATERAPVVRIA